MNFPIILRDLWHGQRFHSFNRELRRVFDTRVYKIGLRLDFTCPNRDGTVAVGGCIYCNNTSHTPKDYRPRTSVTEQLEKGAQAIRQRHRAGKFIAYFQSYTNTYDATAKLERLYREALDFPDVVGLAIATRPDCLPDATVDLLGALSKRTYLWLELGLESMYDRTLAWINRGHDLSAYVDAVSRAKQRNLRLCTHLILGLPGESREEILATSQLLNRLDIDGVKLHNLHVIRDTVLEKLYHEGQVPLLSRDDYVRLVVDFLEQLNPRIIVHRLTGETYRAITVAPDWSINKMGVHNRIYEALESRDTWQGRLFSREDQPSSRRDHFTAVEGVPV
jgi:uncharacterized protein